MQFSYLHFKHPNILPTSDELLWSNVFLESITPETSEMKKSVRLQHTGNQGFYFSMFLVCQGQTDFFLSDILGVIDSSKKFDCESLSKVCTMVRCLNRKYENCLFIRRHLKRFYDTLENCHIWIWLQNTGTPQKPPSNSECFKSSWFQSCSAYVQKLL